MQRALASLVAMLAAFAAERALAVPLYALYGKDCHQTTGALVGVDETTVSVLRLNGVVTTIPLHGLDVIARYDVLENPFPRIQSGKGEHALLRVTSESSEGTFDAYATDFSEELVLFLDVSGKIRVVQSDEIIAIARVPDGAEAKDLASHPLRLQSPPGRASCPAITSNGPRGTATEARVATLVMADSIKIDSFWAHMRAGYRDLESLRERTMFYARPVMFDVESRLGLMAIRTNRYELLKLDPLPLDNLPMYLEFGGGNAYRFQSSVSLGTKSWRMVPQVRPIAAVRSEFKSHLLHGIFIGNLSGLTAGKPMAITQWSPDPREHRQKIWLQTSFNHLTLLGVDYGPWSVSYGYYFPVVAIGQGSEMREILATKASPVGRLAWQTPRWQIELFGFNTELEGEGWDPKDVDGSDMRDDDSNRFVRFYSGAFVPEELRLTSTAVKLAATAFFPHDLLGYADLSFQKTTFKETGLLRDVPLDEGGESRTVRYPSESAEADAPAGHEESHHVEQRWLGLRLGVRMDLGKWVALGAEASQEQATTTGGLGTEDSATDRIHTYIATMELLL
jgi:hypothetical protein